MQKVRNKTNQPLVLNCQGRVLHLLPGAYAVIADEDLRGPEVQGLLRQRRIESFEIPASKEPKTSSRRAGSGEE